MGSEGVAGQPLGGQRTFEPVVFTGADLVALLGLPPDSLAAFRYDTTGWTRIPSQVDQREYVDLAWAYNGRNGIRCDTSTVEGSVSGYYCFTYPGLVFGTVYMDAGTFTGPDGDPSFDADDELVFMARDAGSRAPVGTPPPEGVFGPSGQEVVVALPLTDGARPLPWYVYLFHHDGRYTAVDTAYVAYDYHLLSGDFFTTYDLGGIPRAPGDTSGDLLGANPEDSWVETPHYRRHFGDRWIEDGLEILTGTGVDLRDRVKWIKDLESCSRTDYSGSVDDGAMIANIAGPVRAIRSVIGFNSGPFRQRDQLFYDQYAQNIDYFRVHFINGMVDFFDQTPAAAGMAYTSNLSPTPRTVDGVPDAPLDAGTLDWDILQGPQGTLVTKRFLTTTIVDMDLSGYYLDEAPATILQCSGNDSAYGSSGMWITSPLPNTDPARGDYEDLTFGWHQLYAPPDLSAEDAQAFLAAVDAPLFKRSRLYTTDAPIPPEPPAGGFARAAEADVPVLRLEVPYPNPARGTTTLSYELGEAAPVRIDLFDLLGRRVATLDQGVREAGRHVLRLDAGALASGMYVVRLVTPSGVRAVRLVRP